MPSLPDVHRLITISDAEGRDFCSRVEDVDGELLTLARPLTLPLGHQFAAGTLADLSWPDPDGLTSATVRLLESRSRGSVGLWVTQLVGELRRQQRRRFVRVPAIGSVELVLPPTETDETFPHVAGHLVDVSEAALRCLLRTGDAQALPAGSSVLTTFTFDGQQFALPAEVQRNHPTPRDESVAELVLALRVDDGEASALRRLVFGEQLRLRRQARESV